MWKTITINIKLGKKTPFHKISVADKTDPYRLSQGGLSRLKTSFTHKFSVHTTSQGFKTDATRISVDGTSNRRNLAKFLLFLWQDQI